MWRAQLAVWGQRRPHGQGGAACCLRARQGCEKESRAHCQAPCQG